MQALNWYLVWLQEPNDFSTMDAHDIESAVVVAGFNRAAAEKSARVQAAAIDNYNNQGGDMLYTPERYRCLRVVEAVVTEKA